MVMGPAMLTSKVRSITEVSSALPSSSPPRSDEKVRPPTFAGKSVKAVEPTAGKNFAVPAVSKVASRLPSEVMRLLISSISALEDGTRLFGQVDTAHSPSWTWPWTCPLLITPR